MIYDNTNSPGATVYDMSAQPPTIITRVLAVDTDAATVIHHSGDDCPRVEVLQFASIAPGLAYGKVVRFNCYKVAGMKFKARVVSLKVADDGRVLASLALPTNPARGAELGLLIPKDQAAKWLPGATVTISVEPDHD